MRRRLATAAIALAAIAIPLTAPAAASGGLAGQLDERLRIDELRVWGGEVTWHPKPEFRVSWDRPSGSSQPKILAIDYLVEDAAGDVVVPTVRIAEDNEAIEGIAVPPLPGEYTVSVWLEGSDGAGPPVQAHLRFDDTRPAAVSPLAPPAWFRAGDEVAIQVERPLQPWPLAGIRGYAIAVDRGAGVPPCAGPDRCTEDETDLSGGAEDDWASLGPLEPGTSFARVVAVSGSGMRSTSAGSVELRVDGSAPNVRLDAVPAGWSAHPVTVRASAADTQSGMEATGGSRAFTAIAVDGRQAVSTPGDTAVAVVHGEGLHTVTPSARDAVGNATPEGGAGAPRSAMVGIDETAPRVTFVAGRDPGEPERIEAVVSDSLSGPSNSQGTIALRPAESKRPFAPIPATISGGRLVTLWDSDSYPAGRYEFRVVGYDAAGNRASTELREDGEPMQLRSPLKQPTRFQLGFGGSQLTAQRCWRRDGRVRCQRRQIVSLDRRPAHARVSFGRAAPLAGRLTSSDGMPLAGEPVDVIEELDLGGDASTRTTTVETGSDGDFFARLAPGPSRRIRVAFAGDRLRSRSTSRGLRLAVGAAVKLRASAAVARVGGAPVVFSGSLAPTGPGHPVELQFRVPGQRWSEFRTVQTDARGRFRYAYAFSDDDSRGVRFQFRAHAPRQPSWPYAPGSSLPVTVTGL